MPDADEQPDLIPIDADGADGAESPEDADVVHFRWRIAKNLTRRLDQYLVDRVGYLSRNGIQRLIDDQLVKVNDHRTKASYHPRIGDIVQMVAPPDKLTELVPEDIPLDVLYEDEHFLAINKQRDIIVHPARGKFTGTLVNALVFYGKKWSRVNGDWRPGILHRLDRNTTGVMLVAKSDEAHWRIARQFEYRTIQKTYMAVCHGVPELLGDIIDMPIGKDRYLREKQAVRSEANGGRSAITLYEVKDTFETVPPDLEFVVGEHVNDRKMAAPPPKFSLIKLSPKTGRTHQLRVHMSVKGYPMVGDTMYGGRILVQRDPAGNELFRFNRQALHAYEITFTHPATLKPMTIQAPLPPDFIALMDRLRPPG